MYTCLEGAERGSRAVGEPHAPCQWKGSFQWTLLSKSQPDKHPQTPRQSFNLNTDAPKLYDAGHPLAHVP